MLKLFGSKPDHPMAGLREARNIVQTASGQDGFKALEELSHWMDSVRGVDGFKPDHRAQLLILIDDAAQPHLRKLQRDYLSTVRLSRFQEQRLWNALHGYYKQ